MRAFSIVISVKPRDAREKVKGSYVHASDAICQVGTNSPTENQKDCV